MTDPRTVLATDGDDADNLLRRIACREQGVVVFIVEESRQPDPSELLRQALLAPRAPILKCRHHMAFVDAQAPHNRRNRRG